MKYYRTVFVVEVLSTCENMNDLSLSEISNEITFGEASGSVEVSYHKEISEKEMRKKLLEQGSDPEFLIPNEEDCV